MFPILVGFGSALLFGIFVYATYGINGITNYTWTGMMFWALIASGLLVFAINRKVPCLFCRLSERVRAFDCLCRDPAPCRKYSDA
jgi:hypothetical protein